MGMPALVIPGKDNYGKPRQAFANKLAAASVGEFVKMCKEYIWLSAYAANNPRSDYHWQCDACYDEAVRRNSVYLYSYAWHRTSGM